MDAIATFDEALHIVAFAGFWIIWQAVVGDIILSRDEFAVRLDVIQHSTQ